MLKLIKTHTLALGVGLIALGLVGCTSGRLDLNVLDEPISVNKDYIYYSKPSEKTLAREQNLLTNLMMVLDSDAKTPEDKAEIFYEIASIYDDLGLEHMARFMLMNSIVNKPGFYKPYELLGIYFVKDGRTAEACDAFDAALQLDENQSTAYPYLNRAFAMYYTRHYKQAYDDMMYFYQDDPSDPYRLLNLYFIEIKVYGKKSAFENLKNRFETLQQKTLKDQWGYILIKTLLGQISVDDLFYDIKTYQSDDDLFREHLCEAYFYLGKVELEKGNDKLAYDYFALTRQTRKYGFLEYRNAYLEMYALEKKYHRVNSDDN